LRRYRFDIVVVLAVSSILYFDVFPKLVQDWWNDENYSHGLIVPFVIGFLYWTRRGRLREIPESPSYWGWTVFLTGLLLYVAGRFAAEYYLTRVSFLVLFTGIVLVFHGTGALKFFLPGVVLFLMAIPLPYIIYDKIAFPLKLLASRLAGIFLEVCGVPVFREGNIIHLPSLTLSIEDACSGLRSLMAFLTIGVIVLLFSATRKRWNIFFLVMTVVVAILANVLRIVVTGLLSAYYNRNFAEGFYHAFSGWLIFMTGLSILALIHKYLPQEKR
jgi:exosortase